VAKGGAIPRWFEQDLKIQANRRKPPPAEGMKKSNDIELPLLKQKHFRFLHGLCAKILQIKQKNFSQADAQGVKLSA
jgi:hypothetical protein